MRKLRRRPVWVSVVGLVLLSSVVAAAAALSLARNAPATAKGGPGRLALAAKEDEDAVDEPLEAVEQYAAIRTAPAGSVTPGAFEAAFRSAAALPVTGGAWTEVTNKSYDNDDPNFRDPFFSNSSAGWSFVTGRIAALAVDPANSNVVYAGGADGGVWKTTNRGVSWSPLFDQMGSLSIGSIAINPKDGSVWVGTGEANTAGDNYAGVGVYRSGDGGATWQQVGGDELENNTISKLEFSPDGSVYAATNFGLWKRSTSSPLATKWDRKLVAGTPFPFGMSIVQDVAVRPGTAGKVVVANMAWRSGAAYNGFYISRDGGETFTRSALSGAINPKSLGRSTFAYSADGSKLYAVVQDAILINTGTANGNSNLAGVFVSNTGDPAGPWNQIADYHKLANANPPSALKSKGFYPGVQAWYNQFLAVDPANDQHIYVGLEEVFETRNGGSSWHTVGPYWNFPFSCWSFVDATNTCPQTTHPDQHAIALADGRVYVGNDGGVWSRSISQSSRSPAGWTNLNRTLRTLQYYSVGAGLVQKGNGHDAGEAVWGGLQDNGQSLLATGMTNMVSPFGGDGGDTIVDPANGDRAVMEYVNLNMWKTTNAGFAPNGTVRSLTEISPSCLTFTYTPNPCDPNPRFIAPFEADAKDINRWIAGGQYVWDNQAKGWNTSCSSTACDWKKVWDLGPGNSATAVASNGAAIYAAWCAPGAGCNPASTAGVNDPTGFGSGIDTNALGTWRHVPTSTLGLPNRYVTGLAVDPADPKHVYATFGGFSRKWIPSAGQGHVFESKDGSLTWTDISGNFPDAPATDLLISGTKLIVTSDVGVFIATAGQGAATAWSRFGSGLPHAALVDLTPSGNGATVLAASHGRGIWRIAKP
jgi:hypothetical protein